MKSDKEELLEVMTRWNALLKVEVFPGDLQDLTDDLLQAGFHRDRDESFVNALTKNFDKEYWE